MGYWNPYLESFVQSIRLRKYCFKEKSHFKGTANNMTKKPLTEAIYPIKNVTF